MSWSIDIKAPRFRFTKVKLWKAVNGHLYQSFNDTKRDLKLKLLFKVIKVKELRLGSEFHCDSFYYLENLPMTSKVQFLFGAIILLPFFSIYFLEWLKEHLRYSQSSASFEFITSFVPDQDSFPSLSLSIYIYIHTHTHTYIYIYSYVRDGTHHFLWHKITFYTESYLLRKPGIYGTEERHWATKTVLSGIYTIVCIIQFISTGTENWMLHKRQKHGLWRWFWRLGWGDE